MTPQLWGQAALLLLAAGCQASPPTTNSQSPEVPGLAIVDRHVDGDTIDVVIAGTIERVRLTGIDTPEVAHEGTPQRPGNDAECFGDAAAAFVRDLLPLGSEVRLERDVVARDDYGRLLAYVYRTSDEQFVNVEIVRQGFAQPMTIPPNVAYAENVVDAARDAEANDRGLWAACAS